MAEGRVFVKGTPDRSVTFGELAKMAGGVPGIMMGGKSPGLEVSEYHTPSMPATSAACHICVVQVDTNTGFVKILRHHIAHDCGVVLNPLLLEGQVHGGAAHGIGEALIEEVVFDENGTPQASTFLDYLLPLSTDVPDFELSHIETPSPFNPLGIKGAGGKRDDGFAGRGCRGRRRRLEASRRPDPGAAADPLPPLENHSGGEWSHRLPSLDGSTSLGFTCNHSDPVLA